MSEQRDGKTPETALDGIVEVQMTTTEYEHIQDLLEREKHTFCAFCGGKFPGSGTTDDLKEHMLLCEHHPMAAQRQRIAQLEAEVKDAEKGRDEWETRCRDKWDATTHLRRELDKLQERYNAEVEFHASTESKREQLEAEVARLREELNDL